MTASKEATPATMNIHELRKQLKAIGYSVSTQTSSCPFTGASRTFLTVLKDCKPVPVLYSGGSKDPSRWTIMNRKDHPELIAYLRSLGFRQIVNSAGREISGLPE
jgi:DhnA family fructose-bisphosphate aldolase class Ia